jgi:predicted RNase H-like HicB family nuclease
MRQVILIPDLEDGGFIVEVPSLPGCRSEGDTREEALENIRDAIELYEDYLRSIGKEVPEDYAPLHLATV